MKTRPKLSTGRKLWSPIFSANRQKILPFLLTIFGLTVLAGCQASLPSADRATNQPEALNTATTQVQPTHIPDPTSVLTSTLIPASTSVPTDTPLVTPTLTLVPTELPASTPTRATFPSGAMVISPENASQVQPLAIWGRGFIRDLETAAAGKVWVVNTPYGLYLYETASMKDIAFIGDVKNYIISPDRQSIFTTSTGKSQVEIWDLASGTQMTSLEHQAELPKYLPDSFNQEEFLGVRGMAFSPDGKSLAVAYGDNQIVFWDTAAWQQQKTLTSNAATTPNYLVFTQDGKYLLASELGAEPIVLGWIWDLAKNVLVNRLPVRGTISDRPVSPDGKMIVTREGSYIFVFNFPEGRLLYSYGIEGGPPSFTPDSKYLLIGGNEIRRLENGTRLPLDREAALLEQYHLTPATAEAMPMPDFESVGHWEGLLGADFSPKDEIIAWGWHGSGPLNIVAGGGATAGSTPKATTGAGDLYWHYLISGKGGSVTLKNQLLNKVVPNFDIDKLAVCSGDQLVFVDLPSASYSSFPGCRPTGVLEFQDNEILARAHGLLVDMVQVNDGQTIHNLRSHHNLVTALAFSADRELLASGTDVTQDGAEIYLWRLKPLISFWRSFTVNAITDTRIGSLVFTPDSKMLIVGGADRYIELYRVWDNWQLKIMKNDSVSSDLALSPDGSLLAAGNLDGSIQLWSIPEGKEVGRLTGQKGSILDLAFSLDGKSLLSTSQDGTVILWGIIP